MSHGAMSTPRAPSRPGLYHDYTQFFPRQSIIITRPFPPVRIAR